MDSGSDFDQLISMLGSRDIPDACGKSCVKVFNRILEYIVPSAMDELPIEQARSQPVNPSHVTINGLSHYCTHNASVNNSI